MSPTSPSSDACSSILTLLGEAEAFRRERVRQLRTSAICSEVERATMTILHILPLGRLDRALDLRPAKEQMTRVPPLGRSGGDFGFDADGFWSYGPKRSPGTDAGRILAYTQWLRSGGIEAFSAESLQQSDSHRAGYAINTP